MALFRRGDRGRRPFAKSNKGRGRLEAANAASTAAPHVIGNAALAGATKGRFARASCVGRRCAQNLGHRRERLRTLRVVFTVRCHAIGAASPRPFPRHPPGPGRAYSGWPLVVCQMRKQSGATPGKKPPAPSVRKRGAARHPGSAAAGASAARRTTDKLIEGQRGRRRW